jgi:hypothetical protein
VGPWTPVGLLAAGVVGYVVGRREAAWGPAIADELRRLRGERAAPGGPAEHGESRLAFAEADARETTERHRVAERLRSEPLREAGETQLEDTDVSTLVGNLPTHPERDDHLNPRSF